MKEFILKINLCKKIIKKSTLKHQHQTRNLDGKFVVEAMQHNKHKNTKLF
jgi:hypothetical protein